MCRKAVLIRYREKGGRPIQDLQVQGEFPYSKVKVECGTPMGMFKVLVYLS